MTSEFVTYELEDGVGIIRIDDGKRNALSPQVLKELYAAFDKAEADRATVVLTGREGVFSAGFDLKVMNRGGAAALGMLRAGYALPARVLAYPHPVVAACNGHSMAMGVFLMLSADYIIGTRGDFRISANEVAIGMTMPRVAAAVLRNRLTPAAFQRAVTLGDKGTRSFIGMGMAYLHQGRAGPHVHQRPRRRAGLLDAGLVLRIGTCHSYALSRHRRLRRAWRTRFPGRRPVSAPARPIRRAWRGP